VGVGTSFQQLNLTNCEDIDDPRSSTRKCETHRASFQHSRSLNEANTSKTLKIQLAH